MTTNQINPLPEDLQDALLVGRVWRPGSADCAANCGVDGPAVVAVRRGRLVDITRHAATVADLFERDDMLAIVREAEGEDLGDALELVQAAPGADGIKLLAPCDLQAIKAAGVTFAVSLLERVIEEQAKGDPGRAGVLREQLQASIGTNLSQIVPGSEAALRLKDELSSRGLWSQYMEVGIGPYAEVFTKSQPMSAVGHGADVGLHPASHWNNPEPEIVLAVNSRGMVVGGTLGNDVNLRDIEGRSALLLGKAKDNNGSCAIGPFIRLFDGAFTLDTLRQAEVRMLIEGVDDGFELEGRSFMREISRDPLDLVAQTCGAHHQYPDGFMLFLGTMFSPIKDRDAAGGGFTHHAGDRVSISTPSLGTLVNTVQRSDEIEPWTFGVRALYKNLAQRGLG
jgi:fumarylacetoacetate (FAA) hydrolase family protein